MVLEAEIDSGKTEEGEITTGVDALLGFLKQRDKVSLADVAKELGVNMDVVQTWVDFLVEEKIVGIEYKFTKPYIYLNRNVDPGEVPKKESDDIDSIKDDFIEKAKGKNIPNTDLQFLWKNHVKQILEGKKDYFFQEASKRGLMGAASELWEEYKQRYVD